MPTLTSFSLLAQRISIYREANNLESRGEAFGWITLEAVLDLNPDEVVEAIVDDGMDGGIDAIHLTKHDVHIFTYTYTESFDNAANNFPGNKLDTLVVTFQKIMSKTLGSDDVNPALWEKIQAIWEMSGTQVPNYHFYVCSNKEHPASAAIKRFQDSLTPYHLVSFTYLSLEELVTIIFDHRRRAVNGEQNLIDRSYFPKADGPLSANSGFSCCVRSDPTHSRT